MNRTGTGGRMPALIIGIDPGIKNIGYVIANQNKEILLSMTLQSEIALYAGLMLLNESVAVIIEDYLLYKKSTVAKNIIMLTGAVKFICWIKGWEFVLVPPQKKNQIELEDVSRFTTPHEMDAYKLICWYFKNKTFNPERQRRIE